MIFLDEATAARTNLMPLHERVTRGHHLNAKALHGRWQTISMLARVRMDGSSHCMTIEGTIDFLVFGESVQTPA